MSDDALAAVEYLDGAGGNPHVDLCAEQRVRDRIEEVMDLNVIVEVHPRASPFRKLPIIGGQRDGGLAPALLEQLTVTDARFAHGRLVHWRHYEHMSSGAFARLEIMHVA